MKKLLICSLIFALMLSLFACGNDNNVNKTEPDTKIQSEANDAPEEKDTGDALVQTEGNKIYNTVKDEDGSITVQEYVYEDDVLSEVNVTIKLPDEDAAKEMYDSITNGELKEEYEKYENISVTDNYINAELNSESVDSMKVLNQEQMQMILESSVTTYEISE